MVYLNVNYDEYMAQLILKNYLICGSKDELVEKYKPFEYFIGFLDSLSLISQNEPAFFLLSDAINEKILTIINEHRSEDDQLIDYVNDLLVYLNRMANHNQKMKILMVQSYKNFNEYSRQCQFTDNEAFFRCLAYDIHVFKLLVSGDFSSIDDYNLALLSFNYFLETNPQCFRDSVIRENAEKFLELQKGMTHKFSKRNRVLKITNKRYSNILKKSE